MLLVRYIPKDPTTSEIRTRASNRRGDNGCVTVPVLVVVTGSAGTGKTSLAHELAEAMRCPAICRDEIKEGMAFGEPDFVPSVGDQLTKRTLPVFFGTVSFLIESGVSAVAEAAFQHHVWAPNLMPLTELAVVHVVRCRTDETTARERVLRRASLRSAHADASVLDNPSYYDGYSWLELDLPSIDVDTTDGYAPTIDDLATWVAGESN